MMAFFFNQAAECENNLNIICCISPLFVFVTFQGNVTFSCSEPPITPITFESSNSSYLLLPGTPQIDGLSVSFQFRTWNKDGLLLSTELSENSGSLLFYLHHGRLILNIQKGAERYVGISAGIHLYQMHVSFSLLLFLNKVPSS